jgi:hypothetical protein
MCVLLAAVACAAGCRATAGKGFTASRLRAGEVKSVAVTQVQGVFTSPGARGQIADLFNIEFGNKGYRVIDRIQMEAILAEQEFQASDYTTPEGRAQMGRILNVDAIVAVDVLEYGEKISLSAKLIDIEDAQILWLQVGHGRTGRTLATVGGAVVGGAAGVAVGGDTGGRVVGGLAGAGLGGVIGHTLSRQELEQAQKVVEKMCESLPNVGVP